MRSPIFRLPKPGTPSSFNKFIKLSNLDNGTFSQASQFTSFSVFYYGLVLVHNHIVLLHSVLKGLHYIPTQFFQHRMTS